jgi:PiT family inorganic phosphate transporter
MDLTVAIVVAVALFFDFTNGFHDTANAIATVVATKAASPKLAVLGAALFNFLGAFVSLKVATTIAKGIVMPKAISLHVILAGLIGAILWNLITWRQGLPTSSSHALIGGIGGAAVGAAGFHVIMWGGLKDKVMVPSLLSPFLGLALAGLLILMVVYIARKRKTPLKTTHKVFRRLQLFSGGFLAFTHGTNDAQKTMGVIALTLLIAHPAESFHIPLWVIVASASAMAAGTLAGGWRIMHTLGKKITKLEPQQGFAAEMSTATVLSFTAHFGLPVSTTHTVSGSIVGAGTTNGLSNINWRVMRHIVTAWVITIPCAGLVGAFMEFLLRVTNSIGVIVAIGFVLAAFIYVTRNWTWESTAQLRSRLAFLPRRILQN